MILGTIGGLGLFLFGMDMMSEALKKISGQKIRNLLTTLTKNRMIAVLVGTGITCLIQSSSAMTVMVVGFLNASMLTLRQALGLILGANIGTTITAWLVSTAAAVDIKTYSMPAIGVGFLMTVLGKTQKTRSTGELILGFGVLFVGIGFMEGAFAPLKNSYQTQQVLIWLGHNPILACLAGTAFTMLIQSSSASIAMLQVLAFNGAFGSDWNVALRVVVPFILGDNIGTTITAQIAALRGSVAAKRAAWGHTVFNVIGVMYILPLTWLGWYVDFIEWLAPFKLNQTSIMAYMAISHSVFNIVNTLVFLPCLGLLEAIVVRIVPARPEDIAARPVILEKHLLDTPEVAVEQARQEIIRMASTAKDSLNQALDGFDKNDARKLQLTRKTEDTVDNFQYEITSYLAKLSTKEISEKLSAELPVLLHTVNDLERVSDHAVNIAEIAERKIDQKIFFSDSAKAEGTRLKTEVNQMFDYIIGALENNNVEVARSALVNENNLNRMQVEFRRSHVQRMTEGACSAEAGLIFIDLVDNVEKVGDHLTNIAQSVIGGLQWDGVDNNTLTGEYKALTD